MIPLVFLRVSPFSLLISVLYAFGELNKYNEIMSMRSSGISTVRLSGSVIFLSLVIAAVSFFVQEKILILSQKKVDDIKLTYIKGKLYSDWEEKNIAFRSKDMIIFAARFTPKSKTLEQVILFKEDARQNIVKKIVIKSLVYMETRWVAKDIVEYNLDSDGNIVGAPSYAEGKNIELQEKPEELQFKKGAFAQFSSLKNLKKEIERLKKIQAYNILSNLIINFHQKIADPLSHFFIIVGALPFAIEIKKRKVTLSALGMGCIFGFIYYFVNSISITLSKSAMLLPILSPWLVPLFFLAMGIAGLVLIK